MKTKRISNLLRKIVARLFKKQPDGMDEWQRIEFRKPEAPRDRARMLRGEWL